MRRVTLRICDKSSVSALGMVDCCGAGVSGCKTVVSEVCSHSELGEGCRRRIVVRVAA